ncbi:MAG: hypothetical protein HY909_01685 [Deltaproteobacteria bacterium]|nr:hypothetical protein [Deltaproteobacteria bacterium]
MTTLHPTSNKARLAAGAAVLSAASELPTRPISQRLMAFRKVHAALVRAEAHIDAAEARLQEAQRALAEADVDQDAVIDPLADALVGVGLPRGNPFKGLALRSPSRMKAMGYGAEAEALLKLLERVRKRKGLTPAVKAACRRAEAAARAVLVALKPLGAMEASLANARARRDALTLGWETAFAALKRAARSADDDGGAYFATLFQATATEPSRAARAAADAPTA